MKIVTIVGARPQFIKAAVISRAIAKANQSAERDIREVMVHTGQHYDANMSALFFSEMGIPDPKYNLGIGSGPHGAMTGQMLGKIEEVLIAERPAAVLVFGDTNSTLAGALAGAKLNIPVAHVEAGLRSFNRRMPEEVNRVLTDHVSQLLFAPTETAVENLHREGLSDVAIRQVGDVMLDSVQFYRRVAKPSSEMARLWSAFADGFYLATLHRAENTDDSTRLQSIMRALESVAEGLPVIMPLHPRTRKMLEDWQPKFINLIDPVGYFDMVALLEGCRGVFTDSGGLQKEAFFFGKPCVILRDETEWVELVEHGYNVLAGADTDVIIELSNRLFHSRHDFSADLYGNGHAGERIVECLVSSL